MAAHCSILVWGIPWTEEPGRLPPSITTDSRSELKNQSGFEFYMEEIQTPRRKERLSPLDHYAQACKQP